jgi:hypothetical protein
MRERGVHWKMAKLAATHQRTYTTTFWHRRATRSAFPWYRVIHFASRTLLF